MAVPDRLIIGPEVRTVVFPVVCAKQKNWRSRDTKKTVENLSPVVLSTPGCLNR